MTNFIQSLVSFWSDPFRQEDETKTIKTLENTGVDVEAINNQVDADIDQVSASSISIDEFYNKLDTLKASPEAQWLTDDQIYDFWLDLAKSKWISVQGINIDEELWAVEVREETVEVVETPKIEEEGFLEQIVETPWKLTWAAISQLPEIASNLGGFFIGKPVDALLEKAWIDFPSLEEQFKKDWIDTKEQFQEVLWVDPEDFTTTIWEFWTEVGFLFVPGWQAKLAAKFPQAADKIRKLSTAIDKLWQKAPKVFNTLKTGLTSWTQFAKFGIVSEWETSPEEFAVWAVAWPLIGSTIKWIWKISKGIAEKLELAWLLNPAKLDKVAKQLKSDWIEEVSSVADFLLKKKIKGSKEAIVKDLFADATKSRKAVDSALNKIKKESFDEGSEKALKIINENLTGKIGLEDDLLRFTKLSEKLQTKWLNTAEKNEVKRGMDAFINIFKDSWEVIAGTNKLWASKVRASVQKRIEDEAKKAGIKNIKALNKNTQVSFTLAESIARKDSADQASALINAFAPSWAWAIIGWVWTQWDVFDRLQWAIWWALLWRVAWSTVVKTNIANLVNKLSGLEKFAFEDFIRTKWVKELSPDIMNKLVK